MKKEYDFSKAERGKFYKKNARLQIPIYLNRKNLQFVEDVANRRNTDVGSVVNELIEQDQRIIAATT